MITTQYFSRNSYSKGNLEELGIGDSVTNGENVLLPGAKFLLTNAIYQCKVVSDILCAPLR